MYELNETQIDCPYCGETITVLINEEDQGEQYIEDCQVCCRPITFAVSVDGRGEINVMVRSENDTL